MLQNVCRIVTVSDCNEQGVQTKVQAECNPGSDTEKAGTVWIHKQEKRHDMQTR